MREMSHRERVIAALNHEEPDRVPIDLGSGCTSMRAEAYYKLRDYLRLPKETKATINEFTDTILYFDEQVLNYFDIDFRPVFLNSKPQFLGNGIFSDEWGIKYRKRGSYVEIIEHPLKDVRNTKDLESYQWPDPTDPHWVEGVKERIEKLKNTDYAIIAGRVAWGLLDLCIQLRGFEQFLVDMKLNKRLAMAIIERVADITMNLHNVFLDIVGPYVQIVQTYDDLGTQESSIISPKLYREMIKPTYKTIIDNIKRKTSAKVFLHSDGAISELIEDLIDAGVDILNPIQPLAKGMEPSKLKKRFGNRICFYGGIDQQKVLPYGTTKDVENEVKNRIRELGPGGGYILSVSNVIQPDVPVENIVAVFKSAKKYGRYPLSV